MAKTALHPGRSAAESRDPGVAAVRRPLGPGSASPPGMTKGFCASCSVIPRLVRGTHSSAAGAERGCSLTRNLNHGSRAQGAG